MTRECTAVIGPEPMNTESTPSPGSAVTVPATTGIESPGSSGQSAPKFDPLKPFYLVVRFGRRWQRVDGIALPTGEQAAQRAEVCAAHWGLCVQPRDARRTDPGTHRSWHRDPPEQVVTIHHDPRDPLHARVMRLHAILSYRRTKGSGGEAAMIEEFIDPVPGMNQDARGNRYVCIGDQNPSVLWSCHTDTVHDEDGVQSVILVDGCFKLADHSTSSCLGADDGAGIWLMLEMIEAGVPGLYVFHYGEEAGCIGSKWIRDNAPELLRGIQCAIAFDRQGYADVITHQMTGRCCSHAFATSLARQLPGDYKPCPNGVYTDTAHYIELIPECTNVSVGYFDQHSPDERLDVHHILRLRDSLCEIDTTLLTIERDPRDVEDWGESYGGYGSFRRPTYGMSRGRIAHRAYGTYGMLGEDDEEDWRRALYEGDPPFRGSVSVDEEDEADPHDDDPEVVMQKYAPRSLVELVRDYPEEVADMIDQRGITREELWNEILQIYNLR